MTVTAGEAAHVYVGAFVEELSRAGLRHVCIAPGSRSTPLALTFAGHELIRVWMHLDERSAAFFAVGLARALGEPVALLCTSGTAAANFLPAVVEARAAGVPLLVLTADRPPELRDVGAPQTIDQLGLYGVHAKWFVDVALPEASAELLRYVRALAGRATALARAVPPGPVHLNFPFREPLVPVSLAEPANLSPADALAWRGRDGGQPWVRVSDTIPHADDATVARLADALRRAQRPLFVCGPQHDAALAAPLAALATALGAPLLVDPLSGLRWGTHDRSTVIDAYDPALRHEGTAAQLVPDLVVRFGDIPTSKPLLQYLQRYAAVPSLVVRASGWSDPFHLSAEVVHADAAALCSALLPRNAGAPRPHTAWLEAWRRVDALTGEALRSSAAAFDAPFEGAAIAAAAAAVPGGGTLFVSSSMPVRDLDAFARGDGRALRVLANRGANGIDGVVSTALGASAAGQGPLVLAIGDLALYHDMNGLLAAKLHGLDATILVVNNDGGGIFSFLPQASAPAHFEQLFGTPHGLDFEPVAAVYGAGYERVTHPTGVRDAVRRGVEAGGLRIVELRTDRAHNVELHRSAWAAVFAALDAG